MNKIMKKLVLFFAVALLCTSFLKLDASAKGTPIVRDNANLLTKAEEKKLSSEMEKILPYGGVAFVTNDDFYNEADAAALAKRLCQDYFHGESGTVFLIDMWDRRIEIYSTGDIYKTINKSRANGITDNIYTYATDGDYYTCASKAFEQMSIALEGGRISMPMKYVSNLFIAFGLAAMVMFTILYLNRKPKELGKETYLAGAGIAAGAATCAVVAKTMTKEIKTSHSSGSSGGGGGGFSGGGGSSGGGGGHGF